MLRLSRRVSAPPVEVFAVLADGWLYASWVVGASRMRGVDPAWPAVGWKLHHSAGVWPLVVDDVTEVLSVLPGRELFLRARGWPFGEALVRLRLTGVEGGTSVEFSEDVSAGPVRLLPPPLRRLLLYPRNKEILHRLALLVEGRSGSAASPVV